MRALSGLVLACFVLAAAAACGGGKQTPLEQATKQAQQRADEIRSRLEDAGYTVGGLAGANLLTPTPVQAYTVKVDFASPHSFTLTVLAFRTPAQARRFERSYERQCRTVPACRKLGVSRRGRVVGSVVYSGLVDNGASSLTQSRFDRIVRIATGSG